ncbi:MAG: TatD family deoxyribonuclease [Actinobacteria bacterium HGW-Actinobacteria-10]|nr:MAG: TatD family deoxyribonuclease [Actinobacteria bacterium HGW-Actinobacteria-10]
MPKGPVELPRLGAQTADTHAHLDMLDDPGGALERATIAGVTFVITVADVTETPEGTFDAIPGWLETAQDRLDQWAIPHGIPPEVRVIIGAHPHNAKDFDDAARERLARLIEDPLVAGIGEIGLDFHYDYSPRDDQRAAFRTQLRMAHEHDLPVVVHLREAHDEGLAILSEIGLPGAGCVIHCFTGDAELAGKFVELGCHISFAGPVTFKNAEEIRLAAASIPLDRLLVETDAPFMAPHPYRGTRNEPAWTVLTAAKIAEVRGVPASHIADAAMANARWLFLDAGRPA